MATSEEPGVPENQARALRWEFLLYFLLWILAIIAVENLGLPRPWKFLAEILLVAGMPFLGDLIQLFRRRSPPAGGSRRRPWAT